MWWYVIGGVKSYHTVLKYNFSHVTCLAHGNLDNSTENDKERLSTLFE